MQSTETIPIGAELLAAVFGMVGGAFGAVVWTRTRFSLIAAQQAATDDKVNKIQESVTSRFAQMERRQIMQLQITADIARKVGADGRFSDTLIRYLAEPMEE